MTITPRDAAAALVRREANAQRAREARRIAALAELRRAASAFLRPGERVWVIGSLAWGGFGSHSDVDLVTEGISGERLPELERLAARAAGAPPSIMDLRDLPPSFRARVEREGVLVS